VAELWEPATGVWAVLPPMAQPRVWAAGCVLPSGRFAMFGGYGRDKSEAKAFDAVSWAWQPLPPMPHNPVYGAAMAVARGLLVVGDDAMLFD
jgi:hypothetical protein